MITKISKQTYTCKHCHKVFSLEANYMKHNCTRMKREAELKTPDGQTAWNYYQAWLRYKKRIPQTAEAFLSSNFFRLFINFVKFTKQVKLPIPDKFIWFMVKHDLPPAIWINDEVYSRYIEFLDKNTDPIDQVSLSINTLLSYADNQDIDVSDIFEAINPNELLQMIRVRQVSPWLLLHSAKFKQMWKDRLSSEQQTIMESLIQPEYWSEKITQNPVSTKDKIKKCVSALGI